MADVEGTEKQPCVEVTAETKTDSPTFSNPEEETKLDINENASECTEAKKTDSAENGVKGGEEDLQEQTARQDEKNDNPNEMHETTAMYQKDATEKSVEPEEKPEDTAKKESEQTNSSSKETENDLEPQKNSARSHKKSEPEKQSVTAVKSDKTKKKPFSMKNKRAKECFIVNTGNACKSDEEFVKRLEKYRKIIDINKRNKTKEYKFILVFCPVVSRAGTDIEVAMRKLNEVSATKPAVLVVLHCTIDPECVVPDSSRAVTRDNMVTADCLFHEDKGLYKCKKNDNAVENVIAWLKTKPWKK